MWCNCVIACDFPFCLVRKSTAIASLFFPAIFCWSLPPHELLISPQWVVDTPVASTWNSVWFLPYPDITISACLIGRASSAPPVKCSFGLSCSLIAFPTMPNHFVYSHQCGKRVTSEEAKLKGWIANETDNKPLARVSLICGWPKTGTIIWHVRKIIEVR